MEDYRDGHALWYAVLRDEEDTDHGTGSHNKAEAIKMAINGGYYAVVTVSEDDDFCYEIELLEDLKE